jgi:hypothetical protein
MKLEINNMRKAGKFTNMWKLNNNLMNNKKSQKRNQKGNEKISIQIKMEMQHTKAYEAHQRQF